ncbi:flagellar protein FlgA [Pseudothermotoga hypogea DSM 11164 = NBRC 106472]|uniref:Flagellar protein FlgA n=1 Tax=Pseudothermotoga hypogea DSM 11164 = NBRC 106472 TaxID=1123384 RepID=A0A0X1KR54_9THEM|nr:MULTISPECIES: UxaA family hydrolase [Pseudothermotoga]AJC73701.1 flagellar protein FlgA [Pseudothermotoga hypogea DSM 11164 = NBRC 106472]MBC7123836.1 UxaA family hydrolase [Pseudothermotoga sp.]MDI6861927.1 UxaA family hydrolase [Pseudothermotoga sp.]
MLGFLVHKDGDDVGVAVVDLKKGETARGRTLESNTEYEIDVQQDIPLGHKIALRDIEQGEKVKEYGEIIGVATKKIMKGEHVHVHNIRSLRWG